jgi:formamidopyrimidine-DNA glycosylase
MPELPDVEVYVEALASRLSGRALEKATVTGPSFLRTVEPPLAAVEGRRVAGVSRLGKRVVLGLEGDLFLVIHLMVSGRLMWVERAGSPVKAGARRAKPPARGRLAEFVFGTGTLTVTERALSKRAALHVVGGREALAEHDPGGLEVIGAPLEEFASRLLAENHTLKRALTDPRILSGIGNAYSDEILLAARLSPFRQTKDLDDQEVARLHTAARETLAGWKERLQSDLAGRFPGPAEVTSFRPGFAVHGKHGERCPVCGTAVQRIRYAQNEANYCPRCQTGGRLLADRSLSRLLKKDWPRTIDELERKKGPG